MVIRGKNATLVVLGDIGRSPRMCYHAKSLADKNYHVHIVGYADTIPHPTISQHPNIRFALLLFLFVFLTFLCFYLRINTPYP